MEIKFKYLKERPPRKTNLAVESLVGIMVRCPCCNEYITVDNGHYCTARASKQDQFVLPYLV